MIDGDKVMALIRT
jgi:hypothetical protein